MYDNGVNITGVSFPPDLMTEMMDLTSDLVGTGIPFLDYKSYAERIFFPGHRESPLQRDLDIPECRRQTVEQGLVQLSNLLNSKLFLTKVTCLSLPAACCGIWVLLLSVGGRKQAVLSRVHSCAAPCAAALLSRE